MSGGEKRGKRRNLERHKIHVLCKPEQVAELKKIFKKLLNLDFASLDLGASSDQKCGANLFLNSLFISPLCLIDNSFV